VVVAGQDIQNVRYRQRDRLAIHYHQSYQVRRFSKTKPAFMMERAVSSYPMVHLFDEPQFNTQDGYIGFMLDFFRKLRGDNRLVFICLHPTAAYQITIMKEVCERFLFVNGGTVSNHATFADMASRGDVRQYLGALAH
jgi:ABC-type Na+ transport system ATPase subunit NatA